MNGDTLPAVLIAMANVKLGRDGQDREPECKMLLKIPVSARLRSALRSGYAVTLQLLAFSKTT